MRSMILLSNKSEIENLKFAKTPTSQDEVISEMGLLLQATIPP